MGSFLWIIASYLEARIIKAGSTLKLTLDCVAKSISSHHCTISCHKQDDHIGLLHLSPHDTLQVRITVVQVIIMCVEGYIQQKKACKEGGGQL